MAKKEKMRCPECGVEMNFHAEKPDYSAALANPDKADPDLGAVVQEAHACPECGKTELRTE